MNEKEKAEFMKQFKSNSMMDNILLMYADVASFFVNYTSSRLIMFEGKLNDRIGKEEKMAFVKQEIERVRDNIETDMISSTYSLFTKPAFDVMNSGGAMVNGLPELASILPKENSHLASQEFLQLVSSLVSPQTHDADGVLIEVLRQIQALGLKSPSITDALNSNDPMKKVFLLFIFVHFEKQYIKSLIALYDGLENGQTPVTLKAGQEKIEWLGTQKQLAELFVELEKKGWIKEKNTDLIEAFFTNSNTIKQVLKPSQDSKTKEKLYEGIYTSKYKQVFDLIKPNKPN